MVEQLGFAIIFFFFDKKTGRVDFGDNQRNVFVSSPATGIVYYDCSMPRKNRSEFTGDIRARAENRYVGQTFFNGLRCQKAYDYRAIVKVQNAARRTLPRKKFNAVNRERRRMREATISRPTSPVAPIMLIL